jgi:NADPH-dependent 2,4-dienoyl-CoA reductase/sulfur reductase-like enzyme
MSRFVIIGMGAAGYSAAQTIRRHRPHDTITLLTDDADRYYSRPGLAYLLTQELPERQLFPRPADELDRIGVEQVVARVDRIDPHSRRVLLGDGRAASYDSLLLATGAAAIPPPFPGGDLPGVVTLDSMEDLRRINRACRRADTAVVIGGGITALELVEGLQAKKLRVHYLLRRDRFWSSVLDPVESDLVERRLANMGVKIHRHTEVSRVIGKQNWLGRQRVAGVETKDGRFIQCQVVATAIGVRPRLELVQGTGIRTDRGVLVDERLSTNIPHVYAAGDVAQAYDPLTGQHQLDVLWPVAVAQGRVAGANMAGVPTRYRKGVPVNVSRLADLIVTLIGAVGRSREQDTDLLTISRGDSEVWRGIPGAMAVHDIHEVNRQRLMIKNRRLVGAVLIGDQTLSPLVQRLIEEKIDLSPVLLPLQQGSCDLLQLVRSVLNDA